MDFEEGYMKRKLIFELEDNSLVLKLMDGEVEVKEEVIKKDLSIYELEAYSNTMWQYRFLVFRTLEKYANE